jgi:hypothetical protein
MQSSMTQSCRIPSWWPSIFVIKCFSPSTASSPGLSSPPGHLKKVVPSCSRDTCTHVQSEPLVQSSLFQFYQIPPSCTEIRLQQSCPSHRGAFLHRKCNW